MSNEAGKNMSTKACKHLDYDSNYLHCTLETAQGFPGVKYWHRNSPPYEGAPVNVQFCKKRGRINGIFDCYNIGEMSCHEVKDD